MKKKAKAESLTSEHSNGVSGSKFRLYSEADVRKFRKQKMKEAAKVAKEKGHLLGEFRENKNVWIADCSKCLCSVIIDLDKSIVNPQVEGVAFFYKCDPNAADKNCESTSATMSDEHRKRISGPWKHP